MKPSFDIPENRPAAVFFAAALTLATFSILPISLAGVDMSNNPAEYVRVRSFAGAFEASPKPSPSPRTPRGLRAFSAPAALDAPPFASKLAVPASPEIVEAPPEFLSGGADAGNFSFGEAPGEAFANAAFELSELDSVPRLLKAARIKYPQKLYRRGVEGEARLLVEIDEGGRVQVLGVESCTDPLFAEAARAAASEFLYESPTKGGEKVRARFVLPVPFKISELK